jgi:hypothetical protein
MTPRAQQRQAWQTRFRTANATQMPPRRVHLQIAELEFRGVGRSTANRIAASFESELGFLLARRGIPQNWHDGNVGELRSSMRRERTDYAAGEALANAVWDSQKESRG